jgi:hypothetical protein
MFSGLNYPFEIRIESHLYERSGESGNQVQRLPAGEALSAETVHIGLLSDRAKRLDLLSTAKLMTSS